MTKCLEIQKSTKISETRFFSHKFVSLISKGQAEFHHSNSLIPAAHSRSTATEPEISQKKKFQNFVSGLLVLVRPEAL